MNKTKLLMLAGAFALAAPLAFAAGVWTNGAPQLPIIGTTTQPGNYGQLMGNELLPFDTGLPAGAYPQSAAASVAQIAAVGAAMTTNASTITGAGATGTVTASTQVGLITSAASTMAVGATQTVTVTSTLVTAASNVDATAFLGTSAVGRVQVQSVTPGAGSWVVVIKNVGTAALSGTYQIGFYVQ
jgi:hypothetical protein